MAKQYLQKGRGYAKFLVFFPVHLNLLSLHFVDILLVFSRIRVKIIICDKISVGIREGYRELWFANHRSLHHKLAE